MRLGKKGDTKKVLQTELEMHDPINRSRSDYLTLYSWSPKYEGRTESHEQLFLHANWE